VRSRLVDDGLDAVLARKKRATPPIRPMFDGERQAKLIALACSKLPPGYARWTLRLLADIEPLVPLGRAVLEDPESGFARRAPKL
jgi:hypothetical protein